MAEQPRRVDILIVGAGPVGMALAVALAHSPYNVLLADRRRLDSRQDDPRALALSHGSRELLESVGAWPRQAATPIETIHISHRGAFGRTFLDRRDYGIEALGYVVRYRDLAAALKRQVPAGNILEEAEITNLTPCARHVSVELSQHGTTHRLEAALVIHAEGTPIDEPGVRIRDYHQHAVIAEVRPRPAHGRQAWERFTPDGPLALLPLDDAYSVVLTLPPDKADKVMALNDADFLAALGKQFGGGRLDFVATGPRARFPLALRLRKELVKGREIWIGNAAQTLHPVSGQGFNLGLRDAWQLADALQSRGLDEALTHYSRCRRLDRQGGALFTDGIVRAFSSDFAPLKLARGLGLLALDLFPPARHFIAKRMIWGARAWP